MALDTMLHSRFQVNSTSCSQVHLIPSFHADFRPPKYIQFHASDCTRFHIRKSTLLQAPISLDSKLPNTLDSMLLGDSTLGFQALDSLLPGVLNSWLSSTLDS